jgi:hypothetical protein
VIRIHPQGSSVSHSRYRTGYGHHAASNGPGAAESSHSMEMRYCAPAPCRGLLQT